MSPLDYRRRQGLAVESASTFNSLGLSSSAPSVPLIRAADARRKAAQQAQDAQIALKTSTHARSLHNRASSSHSPCSLDIAVKVQQGMEHPDPDSCANHGAGACGPCPLALKSALAKYPLSHDGSSTDGRRVPSEVCDGVSTNVSVDYDGPIAASMSGDKKMHVVEQFTLLQQSQVGEAAMPTSIPITDGSVASVLKIRGAAGSQDNQLFSCSFHL